MEASLTLWNDLHTARTPLALPSSLERLVTTADLGYGMNAPISCPNGDGGDEEETG